MIDYLVGHVLAVQAYFFLAHVAHVCEMVLVAGNAAGVVVRQDISKQGWSSVRTYLNGGGPLDISEQGRSSVRTYLSRDGHPSGHI
jgi:hypothetical protein